MYTNITSLIVLFERESQSSVQNGHLPQRNNNLLYGQTFANSDSLVLFIIYIFYYSFVFQIHSDKLEECPISVSVTMFVFITYIEAGP